MLAASTSTLPSGAQAAHALPQGVTPFMFPWEKRQILDSGKPLRTWEKVYWGLFVGAITLLLFNRLRDTEPVVEPVDEDKEAARERVARMVLAGKSLLDDSKDAFEGLSPKEIQQYVDKATGGAKSSDPFEGMSPAEINEYMQQHGTLPG
ncbi:hypothetical protein WJX72_003037 [[Myrmecia] bisecta]|uniref:Uncharacterized protein n=1 Tax=[Myrmecia] bisecta TaxID=41462 RepID=A0AAW1PJJ5_9CHLO